MISTKKNEKWSTASEKKRSPKIDDQIVLFSIIFFIDTVLIS